MQKTRRLFNTLKLSAHCLCEQGYNADNLIEIAEVVGQSGGLNSDAVGAEITKTMEFHAELDRKEREEKRKREKEIKLQQKQEDFFNSLPIPVRQEMLKVCENNYWKAVDFASKQIRKKNKEAERRAHVQPENQRKSCTETISACQISEKADDCDCE
jgi:hypothetical protein